VNVSASATVNTAFIGLLPQFKTLTVGDVGQAIRPPVVITMVLDRSGSMTGDGGANALPPALIDFAAQFNNSIDQVAVASFSSDARLDVPLQTNFQTPVANAANALCFGGATWAQGGLQIAQAQENGAAPVPNQVKAVVFFTDGYTNTNQDILSCSAKPINYGGCAPSECGTIFYWDSSKDTGCGGITDLGSCGSSFPSQVAGKMMPFTTANITNDAEYRAIQLANTMRSTGVYIYTVGLGNDINTAYMQQLANDPNSSAYDSTKLAGAYYAVPDCPGSGCSAELDQAFVAIANQILLRLAQ
jgi:hypothetical protein